MKVDEFITYLIEQIGQPYLWGGQHTKLTPENYIAVITRKESNTANRDKVIAYCKKKFADGAKELYAYDCSGLGMFFLQNLKKIYSYDMSANSMMGVCTIVGEPKRGYWVFRLSGNRATHIGYMISDTEVIEAKGRIYGVVKHSFKKSEWDRIGKPKCFSFDPEPKTHQYVVVQGKIRKNGVPEKRVYVRNGNGTANPAIGVAKSEDAFPLIAQADAYPYWYEIDYKGTKAFITSNERYTRTEWRV